MIRSRKLRNAAFYLHRWLGLVIGAILILVGITGSLLVFQEEISARIDSWQFGPVVAAPESISPGKVLDNARAAHPDWQIINLTFPKDGTHPYKIRMKTPGADPDVYLDGYREVFVNPHTGAVMGDREERKSFYRVLVNLHYRLFAEDTGIFIVGLSALFLLVICITGVMLWPGWRKLVNGFKIKWNARPGRLNFDLHKVIGIAAVVFLAITAFTGACWNFYDTSKSVIYGLTGTTSLPDPVSVPILGGPPLALDEILKKADVAFPEGKTTLVYLPHEPEEVFMVFKKVGGGMPFANTVYLDRFSGGVLRVDQETKAATGDRILSSFYPLHFGTFWGLPSRIIYLLVGLAPAALLGTGGVMYWYRTRRGGTSPTSSISE